MVLSNNQQVLRKFIITATLHATCQKNY